MPFETGMYSLSNQINPVKIAQEGQDLGVSRQEAGLKLQQLGQQTQEASQAFSDRQAQRKAMQDNYDPKTGEISQPGVLDSDFAKQNPEMAKNLNNSIHKLGLDATDLKNKAFQNQYANNADDPAKWKAGKEELIRRGYSEAANLPEVPVESTIQRGLIGTMSAGQQLELKMGQRKMAMEQLKLYHDDGIAPPPGLIEMAGLPMPGQQPASAYHKEGMEKAPHAAAFNGYQPGESVRMGKRDMAGQKAYDDSLSQRKLNDPSYATAENDLYAGKKAFAIFNKYEDLNKINTQDAHILAGEMAKIIKGGASPTEQEVEDMMPGNIQSRGAEKWAMLTGKPVPTNNAEFYQGAKDYFGHLRQGAIEKISAANEEARQNALAAGINKDSLAIKHNARTKMLTSGAADIQQKKQELKLSPNDQKALEWARQNPDDEDAKFWLKKHGMSK